MPAPSVGLRAQPSLSRSHASFADGCLAGAGGVNHAFSLDREHKRLVAHVIEFDGIV